MKSNMRKAVLLCGASIVILWAATGCKNKDCCETTGPKNVDGTAFYSQDEKTATQKIYEAQQASGARADAMLHKIHFDGDQLNSLGEAKIDAMLADDDRSDAVTIYVDLATNDATHVAKRDAVLAYAKSRGLSDTQLKVEIGANPATLRPAAYEMSRLGKTELGAAGSSGQGEAQDAAVGMTAAPK